MALTTSKNATRTTTLSGLTEELSTTIEAAVGYPPNMANYNTAPLFWRIGARVARAVQGDLESTRARTLIDQIGAKLSATYGVAFSASALRTMAQFSLAFTSYENVTMLAKNLTWEHFSQLIEVNDELERDFYAWMSHIKDWSPKALAAKICSRLYQHTPAPEREVELTDLGETTGKDALLHFISALDAKVYTILGLKNS
jgi:hypothetical protein